MYQDIKDLIDNNLASGIKIPAVDHREVETALLNYINDNLPRQFDIKYIWADTTYLGDNFETSGLGKNLRLGWALCNGNNGTPNLGGRMIMTYGGDFTTLNQIGGSKDAVVVDHGHTFSSSAGGDTGGGVIATGNSNEGSGGFGLQNTGESGIGKNMPPYYTLIGIMKL